MKMDNCQRDADGNIIDSITYGIIPPERLIRVEVAGTFYCFDIDTLYRTMNESGVLLNPYTRQPFGVDASGNDISNQVKVYADTVDVILTVFHRDGVFNLRIPYYQLIGYVAEQIIDYLAHIDNTDYTAQLIRNIIDTNNRSIYSQDLNNEVKTLAAHSFTVLHTQVEIPALLKLLIYTISKDTGEYDKTHKLRLAITRVLNSFGVEGMQETDIEESSDNSEYNGSNISNMDIEMYPHDAVSVKLVRYLFYAVSIEPEYQTRIFWQALSDITFDDLTYYFAGEAATVTSNYILEFYDLNHIIQLYRCLIGLDYNPVDLTILPYGFADTNTDDIGRLMLVVQLLFQIIRDGTNAEIKIVNNSMSNCYDHAHIIIPYIRAFLQNCFDRDIGSRLFHIQYTDYNQWADIKINTYEDLFILPFGSLRRDNVAIVITYLNDAYNLGSEIFNNTLTALLGRQDFQILIDNTTLFIALPRYAFFTFGFIDTLKQIREHSPNIPGIKQVLTLLHQFHEI
jgi:hypothetical protein